MRKVTTILAVAVLALSACGSGSPTDRGTVHDPNAVIPAPTAEEAAALVDALDAIVPGLADDPDSTIGASRNLCDSHLSGAENLQASTRARFAFDPAIGEISADQADQIIDVVVAETWCE